MRSRLTTLISLSLSVVLLAGALMFFAEIHSRKVKLIQTAYNENYTLYYNGTEKDIHNFDITLYNGRIDAKHKTVYITDRH